MLYADIAFVHVLQEIIEILGTLAFAISGIRHAAAKHYDWFGGFVCGIAVAIGGGTLRDVMLGVTPFWMTSPLYIVCTLLAQTIVIVFSRSLKKLDNAWLAFDTLGLALFTIAGIQKTLSCGHPFWVAITMGCITGVAGGIIRDMLLNKTPVIFQKEIYAMASIAGGLLYWLMMESGVNVAVTVVFTFLMIVVIRFMAIKYHISLPVLKGEK
ncbi:MULTISPECIES: trimeric intracellular cation channel family protein [Prevotellaceae]|uniref:Membrane protein n=2 Tax=Prevotellaceae TaxID=171552 RepID=F9D051_PREDD|nr:MULTISPECIES: trimeric intracellular cation channel family protein [Prevotellaceae]AGB27908.1 putative membrane protein [Prevotella dentalis DSM 3688]EGQ17287.1 YadS protein [Prevotella dentalis DSM 3688]